MGGHALFFQHQKMNASVAREATAITAIVM
jgi:hypothetical protein